MTSVQEIQNAIEALPTCEVQNLAKWLWTKYSFAFKTSSEPTKAIWPVDPYHWKAAEQYIAGFVSGRLGVHQARHDIDAANGMRLEVKFSRLSSGRGASKTTRNWTWRRMFGLNGVKRYDRLILVAEPNIEFRSSYADPLCDYVLFDLPFKQLPLLVNPSDDQLALNSNRSRIWQSNKTSHELYKYEVTARQVQERYGFLE